MMGETVLVRQEKRNKLSTPFEPIPYHVTRIKGSMITAQRTTDNRTVTRNSSFFKSIPPVPKIQPTVADDVFVSPQNNRYQILRLVTAPCKNKKMYHRQKL